MKETIFSPITKSNDVRLVAKIPTQRIIDAYLLDKKMDVSRFFTGLETIDLYRCNATGFEFYWPLNLAGDDAYYQTLGAEPWYYPVERWEHKEVVKQLSNETILEVGCGNGSFLKNVLAHTTSNIEALELNSETVKQLQSEGLQVFEIPVQDYVSQAGKQFDVVCSFQVLEHVSKPFEFLQAQIALLKPGGKLIVGVPNNDSFIGSNLHISSILNEPPHHMGRWTYDSLLALEKIFPELKLTDVKYEPMIDSNVDVYTWNVVHRMVFKSQFLTKAIWKLRLYVPFKWIVNLRKNKIKGQTILVTFTKH